MSFDIRKILEPFTLKNIDINDTVNNQSQGNNKIKALFLSYSALKSFQFGRYFLRKPLNNEWLQLSKL